MVALNAKARFRAVGAQGVIVQIGKERITVVNEAGLSILAWLRQGVSDIEALCQALTAEYEVTADQARADVDTFLDELAVLGIVNREQ